MLKREVNKSLDTKQIQVGHLNLGILLDPSDQLGLWKVPGLLGLALTLDLDPGGLHCSHVGSEVQWAFGASPCCGIR